MNEASYWRQRYEMLRATFSEAVKSAIDASIAPRLLADKESYNLGKLHGELEEREACAKLCEAIATETYGMTNLREYGECAAAIRARGQHDSLET